MKRIAVLLLVGLLIGGTVGVAEAKKKKKKRKKPVKIEREVSATYDTPAPGIAGVLSVGNCGSPSTGCTQFFSAPKEKFLKLEIVDDAGLPATGAIGVEGTLRGVFCGTTGGSIAIEPNVEYTVWVHTGPSPDDLCPGVATAGTVKATFSNYELPAG